MANMESSSRMNGTGSAEEASPASHHDDVSDHEDDVQDTKPPHLNDEDAASTAPSMLPYNRYSVAGTSNGNGYHDPELFKRHADILRWATMANSSTILDQLNRLTEQQQMNYMSQLHPMQMPPLNGSASLHQQQQTACGPVANHQPSSPSSGGTQSPQASPNATTQSFCVEDQFKQVKQLYDLDSNPDRKEFLDKLFSFNTNLGKPINRLPIMAKQVLDLYKLYKLVIERGGLVEVINKKLWQEIIKGLSLPSSITSAAFTLRTQYMKYLYKYECHEHRFSSEVELHQAIDGNKREGRRPSYQTAAYESRDMVLQQQVAAAHQQQQQQALLSRLVPQGTYPLNGMQQIAQFTPEMAMAMSTGATGTYPNARILEQMKILLNNNNHPASNASISPRYSPPRSPKRPLENSHSSEPINLTGPYVPSRLSMPAGQTDEQSPLQPPRKKRTPSRHPIPENNHSNGSSPYSNRAQTDSPQLKDGMSGSPNPAFSAMQFQVLNQGTSPNGQREISVSVIINGERYEGNLPIVQQPAAVNMTNGNNTSNNSRNHRPY